MITTRPQSRARSAAAAKRETLAEQQDGEHSGPHRHHELDREHGRERSAMTANDQPMLARKCVPLRTR